MIRKYFLSAHGRQLAERRRRGMSEPIGRRQFLTYAAVAMTAPSYERVLGANERMQLGIIGSGGRSLMKSFVRNKDVEFTAVCDVYETYRDKGFAEAGKNAKGCGDFHTLVEDKTLAAVIIATPDHWHHGMLVESLRAGKDVYLEKPMSLSMEEGARIPKAAKTDDRRRAVLSGGARSAYRGVRCLHLVLASGSRT
jgi:hypothetical protein